MHLEDNGTTLVRDGKYPVRIGDLAHVDALPDSKGTPRGWNNAKVVRFTERDEGITATVTRPKNRAGTRCVNADRLTKQTTIK